MREGYSSCLVVCVCVCVCVTRAHAREIIVRGRLWNRPRTIISPRMCARVTRGRPGFRGVSVTALAASAPVYIHNQRYSRVSLSWI